MNSIFINWKHYLNEREEIYFGNKVLEFKKAFELELESNGLQAAIKVPKKYFTEIGSGETRAVYDIDDDWVLKVVNDSSWLEANEAESNLQMLTKYSDIFPKIGMTEKNKLWIIVEKVIPVQDFDELIPYVENLDLLITKTKENHATFSSDVIHKLISRVFMYTLEHNLDLLKGDDLESLTSKKIYKRVLNYAVGEKQIDYFLNNLKLKTPFPRIMEASLEYDIAIWDIGPKNLGWRNNNQLVILDASIGL